MVLCPPVASSICSWMKSWTLIGSASVSVALLEPARLELVLSMRVRLSERQVEGINGTIVAGLGQGPGRESPVLALVRALLGKPPCRSRRMLAARCPPTLPTYSPNVLRRPRQAQPAVLPSSAKMCHGIRSRTVSRVFLRLDLLDPMPVYR